MKAGLLDPGRPVTCAPLTLNRPLLDCWIANQPLRCLLSERLLAAGLEPASAGDEAEVTVRGDCWISPETLRALSQGPRPLAIRDRDGTLLAWTGGESTPTPGSADLPAGERDFRIVYPWDLLRAHEQVVGSILEHRIAGRVSPGASVEGILCLGEGSVLLPGAFIEGTVIVGRDCRIGPNCYIRGSTSIGDGCRVGHAVEIKNSILFPGSAIGHLSYCGDSIIGCGVNFGAGTIVANLRHDGFNSRSEVDGVLVDTGRRKFGTVIGDGVHTGIHTSIYPGRKLWPGCSTRPGTIVRRDLHPEHYEQT